MNIGIVGAGPAGLYFALLMKKFDLGHRVRVVEQNPAGATYGWGVVFSERALSYLQAADPESYADLQRRLQLWDDQIIVHQGQPVRLDGLGFSGIARIDLLRILQRHCRQAGVETEFETRVTDLARFRDCDLIVGADGANSVVRQIYADQFQPTITTLSNRYVWYGTQKLFEALTLTFRRSAHGAFVAHHYRHDDTTSTFVVECDASTWARAGFDSMSDDESRAYCEAVFSDDLGGCPLLPNRSRWINFRVISNRRWSRERVVLIGDALRTIHFSIGSGTRMALEDAIALAAACRASGDVDTALSAFEKHRRPAVDKFLHIAARSALWYERFHTRMHLDPVPFAYDYMTRGGRIRFDKLRERSPGFVATYEEYLTARRGTGNPS
jgi:anthraniloyl-CoA monooxygenase